MMKPEGGREGGGEEARGWRLDTNAFTAVMARWRAEMGRLLHGGRLRGWQVSSRLWKGLWAGRDN